LVVFLIETGSRTDELEKIGEEAGSGSMMDTGGTHCCEDKLQQCQNTIPAVYEVDSEP
jgi:hypothetical protein